MKNAVLILFLITCFACKNNADNTSANQSSLLQTFKYAQNATPIISAHRGGKGIAGYPENCLETLQYLDRHISAIYEIDIAQSKDGVLVLMHDDNLERTTTGQGKLKSYTFSQLQRFNLVDDFGVATVYKIPKFKDVLVWAKANKVVLTIDIKRSVAMKNVIKAIRQVSAEDISIIITYDLKQALQAYKLAPELLLSVSARNMKELDWLINSKIPTQNMIAFTGTRLSQTALYKRIHSYGMTCILGTLGNLDNQAKAKGNHLYQDWIKNGIDVIATDRALEVAEILNLKK